MKQLLILTTMAGIMLYSCSSPVNQSQATISQSKQQSRNIVASDRKSKSTTTMFQPVDSILEHADVRFDENFQPTATLKLHNTAAKELMQIVVRFDYFVDDGTASWRAAHAGFTS